MIVPRLPALLLLLLLAPPALAQTGVLQRPGPGTSHDSETSKPATPKAAPVTPVERAGSNSTPRRHHAEKKVRPTPVVQSHGNAHAEKPAGPVPAPAGKAESAPPAPSPVPPPARPPVDPNKGTVTGLPLPRFAALRSDDVNLRVGPGTRFPIEWQYHRRDLPVEILRELEVWRLVEDQDGVKGWVHQATLVGHRTFVVKEAEAVLRRSAEDSAGAVARLKPGVVGRIRNCTAKADWCEVQVAGYRGWLRREQFWGTFPGETVN